TIAQQLKIKDFPFEIRDSKGNPIYYENSNGSWFKYEYDSNGNQIYFERSDGFWQKNEFDSNGKEIYHEESNGFWIKCEYDSEGKGIYYESCNGTRIDKRPKSHKTELTLLEIFETKQAFNKWLKELTETEKLLIL